MTLTHPANRSGFHLDAVLEGGGWKTLHLDSSLALVEVPRCPADGAALRTLATLTETRGVLRLRVGACPTCGHISYIDRPDAAWFDRFYREVWDDADRNAGRTAPRRPRHTPAERAAVTLAKALPLDRARPVCEIGCGHGTALQQLAAAGFSRLIGIEHSLHRADIARAGGPFEVFSSPFEAPDTVAQLRRIGPFGLLFSIHALEHTFHPALVLAAAAQLQEEGDYLIVSVPHQRGEPTIGVMLFLPHLHSFTRCSLIGMAAAHGYGAVDESASGADELTVVFRKGARPGDLAPSEDPFGVALTKVRRGLALDDERENPARLSWSKKKDDARLDAPTAPSAASHRALLISDLRPRVSRIEESPLEIQSGEGVTLFYK